MTPPGRVLLALMSAFLLLPASLAQRPGSVSPPGAANGGGNPADTEGVGQSSPGAGVPITTIPNPNPSPNRAMFVSGEVTMDDGSALPQNVAVVRVCNGVPHIEGYTDNRGYFGFSLDETAQSVLQDASSNGLEEFGGGRRSETAGSNLSPSIQLEGCELRVNLVGYQSQTIELSLRHPMDNPNVGTILLHRLTGTQGTTVSATTLTAPKSARKAFRKAVDLEKKKKYPDAETSLQHAITDDPRYAEAWYQLGRVQAGLGNSDSARQSFEAALRADGNYVPPYIQISLLDLEQQNWQALADISGKAIQLDPFTYPEAFFLNAIANYNLHYPDVAEQNARRAEKLDVRNQIPQVSRLLGTILMARRDFAGAAAEMRRFLKLAPLSSDAPGVRSQLAALEKQSTPH